ncbi:MAG: hypothetical protein USCGTAYLOR_02445 [Chromatiales bacterium USCg_Taylor]|nr:MAG: hypothetical protein USCGTAYLOR_02445 [Chromatiales bacterium USCg_Taylor]
MGVRTSIGSTLAPASKTISIAQIPEVKVALPTAARALPRFLVVGSGESTASIVSSAAAFHTAAKLASRSLLAGSLK